MPPTTALLSRNSEIKTYSTSRFTYAGLRIFFRRHQHFDQLPKSPAPLPLLVFIHGPGAPSPSSIHCWQASLLSHHASLSMLQDAAGLNSSERSWDAYTTDALVELLEIIIDDYREQERRPACGPYRPQYGLRTCCSSGKPQVAAKDRSQQARHRPRSPICPSAGPPDEKAAAVFRKLLWIPETIFNLWRAWDQVRGSESPSVRRFVGVDADPEAKRLQAITTARAGLRLSAAWRTGCCPHTKTACRGRPPGEDTWSRLKIPVYLIGGANDKVTPSKEVDKIAAYLKGSKVPPGAAEDHSEAVPELSCAN